LKSLYYLRHFTGYACRKWHGFYCKSDISKNLVKQINLNYHEKIVFLAAAFAFLTLANAQTKVTTNPSSQTRQQSLQTSDIPVVVITKFQNAYPAVT
jgi:hypothetical protein